MQPHAKRRGELYGLLGKYGIFPLKMHSGQRVFFPIIRESDLEEILKKEVRDYAKEKGFEIKTPIEYTAMKTVVVKEIDSIIDEFTDQEIIENIERVNDWAKVVELYKFQTTAKMLKIQFETTTMATRALNDGLIILFQRVPPRRIEKEIFVKLLPCNNCYGYDHDTKSCKEAKQTLCAFCGSSGHKQSTCTSLTPKCINCGEAHRTLAAQCHIRKEIIKTKRKELRQRSRSRSRSQVRASQLMGGSSYAEATRSGTQQQRKEEAIVINSDPNMKKLTTIILSAVVYSQYMESINPGSFQENMDCIYEANGLQKVKFPSNINIRGMKELYKDILREKVEESREDPEEGEDEAFEEAMAGEMEVDTTAKRHREVSVSPTEVTEAKKKREKEFEEPSEPRSTLKLKPQEKPPVPPPMIQRTKKEKKQETPDGERVETEIAEKLRREREGAVRPRTSSQSSVTSVGSTGSTMQDSTKNMKITIYVQESDFFKKIFAKPLTQEHKETMVNALIKGKAKITWDHPQIKKENLVAALSRRKLGMDRVAFRMVSVKDYWDIQERSISST